MTKPWCCFIEQTTKESCANDATLELWFSDAPEDYTHTCQTHKESFGRPVFIADLN